jgi:hypothetical protein
MLFSSFINAGIKTEVWSKYFSIINIYSAYEYRKFLWDNFNYLVSNKGDNVVLGGGGDLNLVIKVGEISRRKKFVRIFRHLGLVKIKLV